jgi:carbon storage regulator
MLVLTRKLNESITIDGEIEVMVVAVHGNKVRLGCRAPADVSIRRTECVTGAVDQYSIRPCVDRSPPVAVKPA